MGSIVVDPAREREGVVRAGRAGRAVAVRPRGPVDYNYSSRQDVNI
ncbi:hypothetical protein ACFUJ0_29060 [Streptomyces sp. NPDC057242]